jgi:hypothetical protein
MKVKPSGIHSQILVSRFKFCDFATADWLRYSLLGIDNLIESYGVAVH